MKYLERYAHYKQPLISSDPNPELRMIIVIPCYNEPDILPTLRSLNACLHPQHALEVVIVINASEIASDEVLQQNQQTARAIREFQTSPGNELTIHIIEQNELPKKHAGVGLARKIGMDEAVRRFHQINSLWDGIIVCLDADSLVETNYLAAIEQHFEQYPKTPACSIHFEHPIDGENAEEIINYELHLRYFINAQRFAKHPHAYQTVGSSMAVRAEVYAKQGGMPKRQAGEDFYFLHKIIPLGNFTELNSTKTIPSPRSSDRVPFGTGKDIGDQLKAQSQQVYTTYNFQSFIDLKKVLQVVPDWFKNDEKEDIKEFSEGVQQFFKEQNLSEKLMEIHKHSGSRPAFVNRFYQWFNGFLLMKYCHFMRDYCYPDQPVEKEASIYLERLSGTNISGKKELLTVFREIDTKP